MTGGDNNKIIRGHSIPLKSAFKKLGKQIRESIALRYCEVQIYSWIPGGIRQIHKGTRTLRPIKYEEVTKSVAVRCSRARGNVSIFLPSTFVFSMNANSSPDKDKVLEKMDLSMTRIKLIYVNENVNYSL